MRVLFISDCYPAHDRQAGHLRLYNLLGAMASRHDLTFHAYRHADMRHADPETWNRYRRDVENLGIRAVDKDIRPFLSRDTYHVVWFEFYLSAVRLMPAVRYIQPAARTVVDTVDVHFRRLLALAELTGRAKDYRHYRRVMRQELSAYRRADALITVTEQDRECLLAVEPDLRIFNVPIAHHIHPFEESHRPGPRLIFIGGFIHHPNVDAVLYFHEAILPLIRRKVPDIRVTVVGGDPPDEVTSLRSDSFEVTGYVPDTSPYLASHAISIAPLRYGAGMKGKVGEAMAHGIPVVTTTVGAEGFGLTPGVNVLIGDTPEQFACHVANLLGDRGFYDRIRHEGWKFIQRNYSVHTVSETSLRVLEEIGALSKRRVFLLPDVRTVLARLSHGGYGSSGEPR